MPVIQGKGDDVSQEATEDETDRLKQSTQGGPKKQQDRGSTRTEHEISLTSD